MEVDQAVEHGIITKSQSGSVLEGLKALEDNLTTVRSNAIAASVDHLDSGRDDASARAKDMASRVDSLLSVVGKLSQRISEGEVAGNLPRSTAGKRACGARCEIVQYYVSDVVHVSLCISVFALSRPTLAHG